MCIQIYQLPNKVSAGCICMYLHAYICTQSCKTLEVLNTSLINCIISSVSDLLVYYRFDFNSYTLR